MRKRRKIPLDELTWSELAQTEPELLRRELESRLAKPVQVDRLASEIIRVLRSLGRKPGTPETVARNIAAILAPRFKYLSESLERTIANRPTELAAAVAKAEMDFFWKLAERIAKFPPKLASHHRRIRQEWFDSVAASKFCKEKANRCRVLQSRRT